MTATLAVDELTELRAENTRLQAQVVRLQNFAFRDLRSATAEELQCTIDGLPAEQRNSLRRLLTPEPPVNESPVVEPDAPAGVDLTDEQRADAWRRTYGILPPLSKLALT